MRFPARALRHWLSLGVAVLLLGATGASALIPVHYASREEVFEIAPGTWKRRMAGAKIEILPSRILLALGVKDVLVLRNLDDVPQIFGPTLIMPGQSFRLPFDMAAENSFQCTAHASGQLTVLVEENPTTPWARLRWRTERGYSELKTFGLSLLAKVFHA